MTKKQSNIVFLGLGSNIEPRINSIKKTIQLIEKRCGLVFKKSKTYESEPWGFQSKNPFLNLCIEIETIFNIEKLFSILNTIEKDLGRQEKTDNKQYSDRIIDIDILYFNSEIINNKNLQIPHSTMHERKFVLKPLSDIAPKFIHPLLKKSNADLLNECQDISKLSVYLEQ